MGLRKHNIWRTIEGGQPLPEPYDTYRVVRTEGEMGDWQQALRLHLSQPHEPVLCPYCRSSPLDFVWMCRRKVAHGECWCHTCKLWFGPLRVRPPAWMPQALGRSVAMPTHVVLMRPWWGRFV